jgi:hypothetical protein
LDFDNDGREDMVIVDYEGRPMLLHNLSSTPNHWVTLDLRSNGPNRFAYGARVSMKAAGQTWLSYVSPASSYLSSSDPRIHFGLGPVTRIDELTIRWPDGSTETHRNLAADHFYRVMRGHPPAPVAYTPASARRQ